MRRQQIRKALDEYADAHLPPQPDLWPAIRRRTLARTPQAGRIYIEPAGRRVGLLVPAALVLLLVGALVVGPLLLSGHPPGPAGTPPPSPSGLAATAAPGADAYYANLFTGKLAARLGVDPARLDAALVEAVAATNAEGLRDGTLSPAEADQAKAQAGQGVGALFSQFLGAGAGPDNKGAGAPMDPLLSTPTP